MTDLKRYRNALRAVLTPAERRVFRRLNTPQRIQNFLDTLPINFEMKGETQMSPRRVLKSGTAHCAEGAILAAAAFAYHGRPALLMDFQALLVDEDHIVAVFQEKKLWGAISKTNHAILRWRDPIYRSPRELAISFAHEYYLWNGRKSLLTWSKPFTVSRYAPKRWVTAEEDLDWLLEALDSSPHFPVAPKQVLRKRRRASEVERRAMTVVEWRDPRKKRRAQ